MSGLNQMFEDFSTPTIHELDTDVVESQVQSRKSFRNIEELAATIEELGQLQPIIVKPSSVEGRYIIRSGERRWRACQHLGITVQAIISESEEDVSRLKASELVENIQRDNLLPLETAAGIQEMIDAGRSKTEVAKLLGKNPAYVSIHLGLLNLPDEARVLAEEEVVTDPDTLNGLRKLHKEAPEVYDKLCSEARDAGLTRATVRKALQAIKAPPESNNPGAQEASSTAGNSQSRGGESLPGEQDAAPAQGADPGAEVPTSRNVFLTEGPWEEGQDEEEGKASGPVTLATSSPAAQKGGQAAAKKTLPAQAKARKGQGRGDGWTEMPPEAIDWKVVFSDPEGEGGSQRMGTLLVNRVDDDEEYLWVECEGEALRLPADNIAIVSARPRRV